MEYPVWLKHGEGKKTKSQKEEEKDKAKVNRSIKGICVLKDKT